jgi:membrane protease YdiL (CAAX protease family)
MSSASSKVPVESPPKDKYKTVPLVPWNPWLGVAFVAVLYYVAQLLSAVVLSIYPRAHHWSHSHAVHWLNHSINAQFLFVLLAEGFMLAAVYWFLKCYRSSFSIIGLKRPRWTDPLYGLAAVPVYYVFYLLTIVLVGHLVKGFDVNQQQQIGFSDVHGALPLTLTFLSLVILPPLAEEIMVRGFLYSSLKKAAPTALAVIGTSLIFAAAHLPDGGATGPLYVAAVDTFVLSLFLIYLRERTGSLWASITLHAFKNGVAFLLLFVLHVG